MTEKKELRKRCIEKMNALPQDYCREADGKIFSAVLGLPEYRNAKTVFCFVGMQAEIQTASLIEEMLRAGKQVAVPRCAGKGVMHAHVIRSLAELRPGTMGILEPAAEAPVLSPKTKAFRALLIRERLLSDDIPREAHDQPVDAVITEAGVFRRTQSENEGVS